MRKLTTIVAGIVTIFAVTAIAQNVTNLPAGNTNAPPPALAEPEEAEWSFGVSVYGYFVADDSDYAQPTITLDRGWLHLEARYNCENLETGSVWVATTLAVERNSRGSSHPWWAECSAIPEESRRDTKAR